MSLTGGASIKSLLHDLVESLQHKLDKLALGERKLYDFVLIPKNRTFVFGNRFPILEDHGVYLLAQPVVPVRQEGDPAKWDKDGTLAGFSAGSEVAELRRYFQNAGDGQGGERKRRGKANREGKKKDLPPPPPDDLAREFQPVPLEKVESGDYLSAMLAERSRSDCYHRQAVGAGGRTYWQKCPVTTRTVDGDDVGVGVMLEPLEQAFRFVENDDFPGLKKYVEEQMVASEESVSKKVVSGTADLRRYTINVAPALARAMALLLEQGTEPKTIEDLMVTNAPAVASEFERVTGRKVVGVSIHFDSDLPHWNVWHSGLEPVAYQVGGSDRTRFRRTAMNLNASGNMLAWDRVSRAFARSGEDFRAISAATAKELEKAESRAQKRQGRPPGDFTLNRKADEVLEGALLELGFSKQIDQGYRDFVENERQRYSSAVAGRDGKDLRKIIDTLPVEPGETPLEATQRLVDERTKIESTLKSVSGIGTKGVVSAVEHLVDRLSIAHASAKELRETLQPQNNETPLDAVKRLHERISKHSKNVQNMAREEMQLRTDLDNFAIQSRKIRSIVDPAPGESLLSAIERAARQAANADSAASLTEKRRLEMDGLKSDLDHSRKKIAELEREIGPLRKLKKVVKAFLARLLTSPVAQKLGTKLTEMLTDMGMLVGFEFSPGGNEDQERKA